MDFKHRNPKWFLPWWPETLFSVNQTCLDEIKKKPTKKQLGIHLRGGLHTVAPEFKTKSFITVKQIKLRFTLPIKVNFNFRLHTQSNNIVYS